MSLRDLHRTTESKTLYGERLKVDLHYTERRGTTLHDTTRHDTTRHDKNQRAFASTGN